VKERYQNRIELLQGTLDLLILQTLQWGPQHGYGISMAIRNRSGEILQVDTGSLYPALHRLEKQKWIASEWKISEKQAAGQVLPADRGGQEATYFGAIALGTTFRCYLRNLGSEKDLTQRTRRARSTRRRGR
jgi:PadR family transcriptional regulator, regulatory protein PadR